MPVVNITDDVFITDIASRVFYVVDEVHIDESILLFLALATITDTVTISDVVSIVTRLYSIADTVSLDDVVTRHDIIYDTVLIVDDVTFPSISMPRSEQASFADTILVMKQNNATFASPEEFYYSRNRKRYVTLNEVWKVK